MAPTAPPTPAAAATRTAGVSSPDSPCDGSTGSFRGSTRSPRQPRCPRCAETRLIDTDERGLWCDCCGYGPWASDMNPERWSGGPARTPDDRGERLRVQAHWMRTWLGRKRRDRFEVTHGRKVPVKRYDLRGKRVG